MIIKRQMRYLKKESLQKVILFYTSDYTQSYCILKTIADGANHASEMLVLMKKNIIEEKK